MANKEGLMHWVTVEMGAEARYGLEIILHKVPNEVQQVDLSNNKVAEPDNVNWGID